MSIENTNVSGKTLSIISHRCERSPGMSGRKANEPALELSVESLLVATESSPESRKTEAGDGEYDNNEWSVSTVAKGKRKKKAGRKATWTNTLLHDAVDIIVNDEFFRRHLIFRNRPSAVTRYRSLPLCTSKISHLSNKIKTLLGCISDSEKFPFPLSAVS